MLERIIHDTYPARNAIIWLHGLGADAHDFEPLLPHFGFIETRVVFPNAPERAVTLNGGMRMRAWYDFASLDFSGGENTEDILASIRAIDALVDEQVASGVDRSRILLAGFSQGGVIALATALSGTQPLAGVVALSTYLPHAFRDEPRHPRLPILQCHGRQDAVIPLAVGFATGRYLSDAGYAHRWLDYHMGHQVCGAELEAIRAWLEQHRFT